MLSCCVLLRSGPNPAKALAVATFKDDMIAVRSLPMGRPESDTELPALNPAEVQPQTPAPESLSMPPVPVSPLAGDEPRDGDLVLLQPLGIRFRVGWSANGLLCFEQVRLAGTPLPLEFMGGATTLLPDESDQVFEIPPGLLRIICAPLEILIRPGLPDPLWPTPNPAGREIVYVRAEALVTPTPPAAAPTPASATAPRLKLNLRLRHPRRLRRARNHPLDLDISRASEGPAPFMPYSITVTPAMAGSLAVPPQIVLDIRQLPARLRFWITPIATCPGRGHLLLTSSGNQSATLEFTASTGIPGLAAWWIGLVLFIVAGAGGVGLDLTWHKSAEVIAACWILAALGFIVMIGAAIATTAQLRERIERAVSLEL